MGKIREIEKGFETLEPFVFLVDLPNTVYHKYIQIHSKFLSLRAYYFWDGSSLPFKWMYKFIYDADKTCKRASLFHDAAYQLMRLGLLDRAYRKWVDQEYRRLCIKDGMSKWKANLRYKALRAFGKSATMPRKNPKGKIIEI